MSCCDETSARVPNTVVSRRSLLKGAALIASVIPAAQLTRAEALQAMVGGAVDYAATALDVAIQYYANVRATC